MDTICSHNLPFQKTNHGMNTSKDYSFQRKTMMCELSKKTLQKKSNHMNTLRDHFFKKEEPFSKKSLIWDYFIY